MHLKGNLLKNLIMIFFITSFSSLNAQDKEIDGMHYQAVEFINKKEFFKAAITYESAILKIKEKHVISYANYNWYLTAIGNLYTQMKEFKKAFKTAQLEMMQKYRDEPQKWAAFVYFE